MQHRPFGNTGLRVSALGFGAGHLDGLSEADAERLLGTALELGVNFIDTARAYGRSEARIGRFLRGRRDRVVLATKGGYGVAGHEDWTPDCIRAGIERALAELQTDYLDVFLLHSCPRDVLARPGLVEALVDALQAGKVRVAGYSGENEDLAAAIADERLLAFETSVNLFDQASLAANVPAASARGAGVIAKRPLGNAPWRFAERPVGDYAEEYWRRMGAMGLSPEPLGWSAYAIRFTAYQPGVSTAIVGTGDPHHLEIAAEAVARGPLPIELASAAQRAFAAHGAHWPGQT